jgi:hypothetical protein
MPDNQSSNIMPPENLKELSRLLTDLVKTIKIVSVYPENNPLPVKLKESFSERFINLITENGGLLLKINRDEIRYQNEVVHKDKSEDEPLAQTFHNSGITEISFSREFNFNSANIFFKTMKAFVNRETGASDLVALLWQSEIPGFDYCTVEDTILREFDGGMMVQESSLNDSGFFKDSDSGSIVYSNIFIDDNSSAVTNDLKGTGKSSGLIGSGAFNPNVDSVAEKQMGFMPAPPRQGKSLPDTALILNDAFQMADSDKDKAEAFLLDDAQFDMHRSTINLLNEIILSEDNPNEFNDTLVTIEKVQSEYLKEGQLNIAGEILDNLVTVRGHLSKTHPQWQEKIAAALTMAGSKEKLENVVPALNRRSDLTGETIESYLNHFGWEALSAVTGILGELEHHHHREAVCQYLSRAGQEHIDIIARGVFDRRWFVVRNSVTILANIGGEKAMSYLTKALGHDDARVRLQVIRGLSEKNKGAELIARLVWDKDEVVRQAAMEALYKMDKEELLNAITNIINDERFVSLGTAEQENLLISYSRLAGEQAVAYLTNFISKWGVTRNQAEEFYQEAAFKALGNNLSEKAEKALLKYNHSWNKKLRRLASSALAYRRQLKYGGN